MKRSKVKIVGKVKGQLIAVITADGFEVFNENNDTN